MGTNNTHAFIYIFLKLIFKRMDYEDKNIGPTPIYGFEKVPVQDTAWKSKVGYIINADLDAIETAIATGGGGTSNYNALTNKPKINGVELINDKSLDAFGILKSNWGISESGKVLKVGSDGLVHAETSTSTVAFADIIGNPTDNVALSTILDTKLTKSNLSVPCEFGSDSEGNVFVTIL